MRLGRSTSLICSAALILALGAAASQGADSGPLALQELDGEPVELSLGPGEAALVVHFWATWCPPCVEELALLEVATRGCGDDVRVVAVNVSEDVKKVRGFITKHSLKFRQLRDATGDVWRQLSGRGLPVNLIWTAQGRRVEVGSIEAEVWKQIFAELGCE